MEKGNDFARWSVAKENAPICAGAKLLALITIVELCPRSSKKHGG